MQLRFKEKKKREKKIQRDRAIAREKEREGGREREREKNVRHILCYKMYKPVDVYLLLSHQTIPAIQSNKDIHNTQSNHIFTQSLYL